MKSIQDAETTKVIFRKWKDGEVIALFPELLGTSSAYVCCSYERIGLHGSANPDLVILNTMPAKLADFKELKKELENRGYKLQVVKKHTQKHLAARINKEMAGN